MGSLDMPLAVDTDARDAWRQALAAASRRDLAAALAALVDIDGPSWQGITDRLGATPAEIVTRIADRP